ncbi:hypothetical protein [Spiroplasma citri]|uniref:hypothetical protein n=1 Tax=Spiroplasma citri TaxID=2133 RepID=UPI0011BAFE4D|nr:hypothetical protein [Spiroplasma citri]QED24646.1 hypothetical protein FRX96_04185 [Spiroplasma citri]
MIFFIQSGQTAADGTTTQSLQVVQGTPILETYTQDQKSIIEQVYLACHFSSPFGDKSDSEQNKTQSLLTKTKDLENKHIYNHIVCNIIKMFWYCFKILWFMRW